MTTDTEPPVPDDLLIQAAKSVLPIDARLALQVDRTPEQIDQLLIDIGRAVLEVARNGR